MNIKLSEHGVKISDDVGYKLDEINKNTQNVNQIINDINRASKEQAKGTSQMTVAVGQIEKVFK